MGKFVQKGAKSGEKGPKGSILEALWNLWFWKGPDFWENGGKRVLKGAKKGPNVGGNGVLGHFFGGNEAGFEEIGGKRDGNEAGFEIFGIFWYVFLVL